MRFLQTTLLFVLIFSVSGQCDAQNDWANWRGPSGDGIAEASQKPPIEWSAEKNVIWKTKVPGRGHASPTVVGNKVFLATCEEDKQTQSVVCFDRATGKQLWQTVINEGALNPRIHPKNTHASPTLACDGTRVFVVFNNHDATQVAALDFEGNEVWKMNVGEYKPKFPFGFGQSPIFYQGNVIVTSDNQTESLIVALDGATGKEQWKIDRPKVTSYSTPVIADVGGKKQMVISGGKAIYSYDPDNGDINWQSPADWIVSCGTAVWDKKLDMLFVSGGYPSGQTIGLKASDGRKVWDNQIKVYEQSMIVVEGHVYALSENGVVFCWRAQDGKEMWKSRFEKEESASPVFAGGHIYMTTERGSTFVFKPNPEKLELIARNKLGDSAFATPSFVDSQIFYRVGDSSQGQRQEWLYCLGKQ